jgi:hypothetical protein
VWHSHAAHRLRAKPSSRHPFICSVEAEQRTMRGVMRRRQGAPPFPHHGHRLTLDDIGNFSSWPSVYCSGHHCLHGPGTIEAGEGEHPTSGRSVTIGPLFSKRKVSASGSLISRAKAGAALPRPVLAVRGGNGLAPPRLWRPSHSLPSRGCQVRTCAHQGLMGHGILFAEQGDVLGGMPIPHG